MLFAVEGPWDRNNKALVDACVAYVEQLDLSPVSVPEGSDKAHAAERWNQWVGARDGSNYLKREAAAGRTVKDPARVKADAAKAWSKGILQMEAIEGRDVNDSVLKAYEVLHGPLPDLSEFPPRN